jgi:hypothetical protein
MAKSKAVCDSNIMMVMRLVGRRANAVMISGRAAEKPPLSASATGPKIPAYQVDVYIWSTPLFHKVGVKAEKTFPIFLVVFENTQQVLVSNLQCPDQIFAVHVRL